MILLPHLGAVIEEIAEDILSVIKEKLYLTKIFLK